MNVSFDAVVQEYVGRMISDLCSNMPGLDEYTEGNDAAKEKVVMSLLTGLVVSGGATHRFLRRKKIDEFRATERLIKHWNWMFPGTVLLVDPAEMIYTRIKRHRLTYFSDGWDQPNPNNPPPPWPN